jgi:membrane fusion protein (multidrug efflux system)
VKANITPIISKVSGKIKNINIADNQFISNQHILFEIEKEDYKNQLAIAQAELKIGESALKLANSELERAQKLSNKDFSSQQALDHALFKQLEASENLAKSINNVELRERMFKHTTISSPVSGFFTSRRAVIGQLIKEGTLLGFIVENDFWLETNLKETQIENLKQGNKVEIKLDAYPNQKIIGTVESLSAATGSEFSLLPQDNANGNFTKVIRRIPVKITIDKKYHQHLKAGLSATVKIFTS